MRAGKVLFYQLAVCAALMLPTAFLLGEKLPARLSPLAWGALAFQGAVVAFASYLAWFWLLTRYRAGPISVFGFLTPLFGVVFGAIILDAVVTPAFIAAVALVGAGIALVNRRS
jgi:drug/metabolite transporter (DMT)-like permease